MGTAFSLIITRDLAAKLLPDLRFETREERRFYPSVSDLDPEKHLVTEVRSREGETLQEAEASLAIAGGSTIKAPEVVVLPNDLGFLMAFVEERSIRQEEIPEVLTGILATQTGVEVRLERQFGQTTLTLVFKDAASEDDLEIVLAE